MDDPEGTSELETRNEAQPAPNQQQTADYIASAVLGLMRMAGSANMPFLAYLLDMGMQEAMEQGGMPRRRRTDTLPPRRTRRPAASPTTATGTRRKFAGAGIAGCPPSGSRTARSQ